MRLKMPVNGSWLNIPVWMEGKEERMEIFHLMPQTEPQSEPQSELQSVLQPEACSEPQPAEKILEVTLSVGEGPCDFYAPFPTPDLIGETILVEMKPGQREEHEELYEENDPLEENDLSEANFAHLLHFSDALERVEEGICRPAIHFTANTGWSNDPNGLIYDGERYHLYFQYNPFGISWGNMSWGHAVSYDLLHWTQQETVMFPDADGCIYSGCALRNIRGCLGLPADALIFIYTAAGDRSLWSRDKGFTQKIAYSIDNGQSLTKLPAPAVPVIYEDSRDPKVFWHEESQAYIMVLWLRGNEFGILRSADLKNWQLTDSLTLDGGWECPDLLNLKDEEGNSRWFFWTAEGYYYPGDFDGWHFTQTGERKCAYITDLPYAAQTFSGVKDRVLSIPWLRLKNDGRPFTGSYGIPVELTFRNTAEGPEIIQRPVRELMHAARDITAGLFVNTGHEEADDDVIVYDAAHDTNAYDLSHDTAVKAQTTALLTHIVLTEDCKTLSCEINGAPLEYDPQSGLLSVDDTEYRLRPGSRELLLIIDDKILEIFFDKEPRTAAFELSDSEVSLKISPEETVTAEIYRIF